MWQEQEFWQCTLHWHAPVNLTLHLSVFNFHMQFSPPKHSSKRSKTFTWLWIWSALVRSLGTFPLNIRRLHVHLCGTPATNKEQGHSAIVSKSERRNWQDQWGSPDGDDIVMFEHTLVIPLTLTLTHTGKSESCDIASDFVKDFPGNIC